ncbi:MAG: AMP-binding protein, partial [Terriglobales bacterium]
MTNPPSYRDLVSGFDWALAERELGYRPGEPLNIGWMCSDRICRLGLAQKLALCWEDYLGNEKRFTFDDLRVLSNTIAGFLVELGLKPGERVCLFLDRVPELYIGFLGILKTGAVAQPLFSAFGDESLFVRLADARTSAIITQKKHVHKVRKIRDELPELRHIIVVDAGDSPLQARETAFNLERAPRVESFAVYPTVAESPSVLHYTSGTTGQPKGAQHVHYSIIAQYLTAKWVLDLRPDDIYWCNADPGWVTGTSYGIIGPWSNGTTQVVLDSGFNAERWYEFMEKYRVTVWYSAPTAIRLLMKEGMEIVQRHDLSSLRYLASVGEPLNA